MITYRELAKLRLKDFLPESDEIEELDGWEFMDKIWVGEAYGFTEWMRLREEPEVLRSVSLDLIDLDIEVVDKILNTIQLPLKYGMKLKEVEQILGKPVDKEEYVEDRASYNFVVGDSEKYDISATIHHQDGLIYLVIMTKEE